MGQQHVEEVAAVAVLAEKAVDVVRVYQVGQPLRAASRVLHDDVVFVALGIGGDPVRAVDLQDLDVAFLRLGDQVGEVPVARRPAVLQRLPREVEHQADHDDQCKIKQAGAGKTTQLGSPRGLFGVPSLATFFVQRSGIGEMATCIAGSPETLANSASTTTPETQASRSPPQTTTQPPPPPPGTRPSP